MFVWFSAFGVFYVFLISPFLIAFLETRFIHSVSDIQSSALADHQYLKTDSVNGV
jgi:hypothetical protein